MADTICFETMDENGKSTNVRIMKVSDIRSCPGFIFLPSHYREDGSCRHDELYCEFESGCTKLKLGDEIYCRKHLIKECGEDYVREVYGI